MTGVEREYRVVSDNGTPDGALWWRGRAPNAAEALQRAMGHVQKFGKAGLMLYVLLPGQKLDPKTKKGRSA